MGRWLEYVRGHVCCWRMGAKRVCVLCSAPLGDAPPAADEKARDLPSYDLCPRCEHKLFAQWGLPFQEFLDGLEAPVVVTDDDVVLRAANRAARELLGRDFAQMEGLPGGLVLECEHALEPEGCGHTIHCSGCVIRHSVTDTCATGTPHVRLPAELDCSTPTGRTKVRFLISTLRRDDVVVLKIENDPSGAE